jgi:hypothetical protein
MATPKNFINSVVFAKPDFSQADGLPRFYPTVDLQGGNIENVVLINGELPLTVPPTGGYVRYDAIDGTIYDLSVNLMNGASNIQLGYQAGDYGRGSRNVMIGYFAANGTGTDLSDSVVIGTQAGVNSDGSNNVFIGPYSGYYTGGSNNVFIGSNAGYDMSGINNNNIFIGRNAGQFLTDVSDTFIVGDASDTLMIGYMKQHRLDVCGNLNIANSINNFQYFKNGSIGINTSNPDFNDYVLDISGSAIVRGNLDICGNFYVAGNIIYDGSGVNIDISNGGLTLLGTGTSPATLQVRDGGVTINSDGTQGAYMTLGYAGNYTKNNANYMIDCSGNIATTGRFGFSGVTNTTSNDLSANISCPSAGALALNTNATEAMRITTSGNVGINNTAPISKLDVCAGTITITDPDSTGGSGYIFSNGLSFNHRYLVADPTSIAPFGYVKPYIGINGDATSVGVTLNGNLYSNRNGQVAINKIPGYFVPGHSGYNVLDVSGNTNIIGNLSLSTGGVAYTNINLDGGNSTGYLYGAYNANLGSGILGDGIHLGYNFLGANDVNPNFIPVSTAQTSRVSVGYGTVGIYTGGINIAPNNLGYYQNSIGNVGIANSNPQSALDVSGSVSASGYSIRNGVTNTMMIVTSNTSGYIFYSNNNGNALCFNTPVITNFSNTYATYTNDANNGDTVNIILNGVYVINFKNCLTNNSSNLNLWLQTTNSGPPDSNPDTQDVLAFCASQNQNTSLSYTGYIRAGTTLMFGASGSLNSGYGSGQRPELQVIKLFI